MPIMKTCKHCGIVPMNHKCPKINKERYKRNKDRLDTKVYSDRQWNKVRDKTMDTYNNMCLWSFYVDGVIKLANEVHHIVTIYDNESLCYELDNLIPLTGFNHSLVHEYYKTHKNECIELLKMMQQEDITNVRNLGKFKSIVKE